MSLTLLPDTADEVTHGHAPVARWSNWWGSPQLLAHTLDGFGDAMEREGATILHRSVVVACGSHVEEFADPSDFVDRVSPEALARFTEIEGRIETSRGDVRLVMRRRARRIVHGVSGQEVVLDVRPVREADLSHAAAQMIRLVDWAHRPFWGPSSWAPELVARRWHRDHGAILRHLWCWIIALALCAAFLFACARLVDSHALALPVTVASGVLGALVPVVTDRAVPNVEITSEAGTRLAAMHSWLLAMLVSALAAQILSMLFGGS
jgi:hypothetical protein